MIKLEQDIIDKVIRDKDKEWQGKVTLLKQEIEDRLNLINKLQVGISFKLPHSEGAVMTLKEMLKLIDKTFGEQKTT